MAAARKGDEDIERIAARVASVQTATLVRAVPDPAAWTYELKWDGYRIVAIKAGASVRLVSRKAQDYTREFAAVAKDVAALGERVRECALDGEVCALDTRGVPSFQLLQRRGRARVQIAYIVFDLLWLDGEDLRALPIEERRARLLEVVGEVDRKGTIVVSSASDGDPRAILALACKRGLEGIVAKRRRSTYAPGRRPTWLKLKCKLRQELAIIGYLPLMETREAVGGLLLAVKDGGEDGGFRYAGKVGTGFDDATRVALAEALERDHVTKPAARGVPKLGGIARFVKPRLVAEVEFSEWTEGGHVRHPSFQGLRTDKAPDECVRETPLDVGEVDPHVPHVLRRRSASGEAPREGRVDVAGVSISHPARVLTPTALTKLDLARYYEAVGEAMLPHVRGRPLTLVRWAEGKTTEKGGVYLRHAKAWGPAVLRCVRIPEKSKIGEYLVVGDVAGLVGLAQMDILEIHTWNSVADDVERPNRVVFDLDPAPDVAWREVVRAARLVRDRLAAIGLASFVKTTGGKGLHVVVPLVAEAGWDETFAFTRAFARLVVREDPRRFVDAVPKHARRGKILVDYLRNNRGNTSVAAFSTRARAGAPVSVPIAWEELDAPKPPVWTTTTVLDRLRAATRRSDPWAAYFRLEQRLPRAGGAEKLDDRTRKTKRSCKNQAP